MEREIAKAKRANRNRRMLKKHTFTSSSFRVNIHVPAHDFTKRIDSISQPCHSTDGATCQPVSRQNEWTEVAQEQICTLPPIKSIAAAAQAGNTETLLALYQHERALADGNPSRLNSLQNQINCALLQAVVGRNKSMVQVLLESGAKVTKFVKHHVVACNAQDLLQLLIERGVEFTSEEDSGLLHDTARVGNLPIMQTLLGVNKLDINVRSRYYAQTPLHVALQYTKNFCANLLLDAGADISVQDSEGMTPLHEAALKGNESLVTALIQRGADPNVLDNKNKSPWFYALQFYHTKTADRILKHMNPEHFQQQLPNGQSFMNVAAEHCCLAVLKKLQELGCKLSEQDRDGNTVLMSALSPNIPDLKLIEYLLQNEDVRSQINHQNSNKDTAMSLLFNKDVLLHQTKLIASSLLKADADVNMEMSEDKTLLMKYFEDKKKRELLLELGADPNTFSSSGKNILWLACRDSDRHQLLEKLLELNIDIRQSSYKDPETGTTAFLEVLQAGDEASAELLYRSSCSLYGVKAWLQTNQGRSVIAGSPRLKHLVTHAQTSGKLVTAPSLWEQARLATLGTLGTRPLGERVQQLGLPATVALLLDNHNWRKWQEHEEMAY